MTAIMMDMRIGMFTGPTFPLPINPNSGPNPKTDFEFVNTNIMPLIMVIVLKVTIKELILP